MYAYICKLDTKFDIQFIIRFKNTQIIRKSLENYIVKSLEILSVKLIIPCLSML